MVNPVLTADMNVSDDNVSAEQNGSSHWRQYDEGDYDINVLARLQWTLRQPNQVAALTLGTLAIVLNVLSITAIVRSRSRISARFLFIISLACSDILVGLTVTAHIINGVANPRFGTGNGPWHVRIRSSCGFMIIKALNTTSLNISLLNLMGMAVDHYLAITKPLHYPSLMHPSRALFVIVVFWVVAVICGFSDFLSVYPNWTQYLGEYNYCEIVWENPWQDEYLMFAIALICLLVMCFTYVGMCVRVQRRPRDGLHVRPEVLNNRKALLTTLFILGTFMVCWLPLCLFQVTLIIQVHINQAALQHILPILIKADKYLYILLLVNAILDPIIYAIRMREVRFGYRRMFWPCCRKMLFKARGMSVDGSHAGTSYSSILLDDRRMSRLSLGSIRMLDLHLQTRRKSHAYMLHSASVKVPSCAQV